MKLCVSRYAFPAPYTLGCRIRSVHVDRYFKQDSAAEITARDTLIKGYNKLKLNTTAGVPLDDEEDPEAAAAGEMTLDKVREQPCSASKRLSQRQLQDR